jgi:hypothetical protein
VLRRFGGILLLLLGALGVVACGVAIYHTGSVKKQVRHFVGQVSDTAENALAGIHHQLDQIDASLVRVRADLNAVVSSADALGTEGTGGDAPTDHIAFALDHGVKEELLNARQLVNTAENTAGDVSRLLTLLGAEGPDSVKTDGQQGSLMARIKGASGTLSRLPGMLERARQTARDLQQNPDSKEALRALTREVGKMDEGLAQVQALGFEFGKTVQGIEDNYRYYREKTLRYIHLGGILIPLLLVWLGVGQVALIILGGRLCMRREN